MTTKQQILLREIIFKQLPGIADDIQLQESILKLTELYPTSVNVENLVEHTLAYKGNYRFVDEAARDFDDIDNSDSKTVTVNAKTGKAEIIGLETKIGAIRITVFNPISPEAVSYLYIPAGWVPLMVNECYGKSKGKKRLIITWSKSRPKRYNDNKIGYFNKFEQFRINTFEDLAEMTDEKFYKLNPLLRLNMSSPDQCSQDLAKTGPSEQSASPYTPDDEMSETLTPMETLPISLSC